MPSQRFKDWVKYLNFLAKTANSDDAIEADLMVPFALMAIEKRVGLQRHQFLNKFKSSEGAEDRIRLVLEDPDVGQFVERLVDDMLSGSGHGTDSKKSERKAMNAIESGEDSLQEEKFEEALDYFVKAVAVAPHPGEGHSLALGLAKRSVAFFHLDRFSEAILDVNDALASGVSTEERQQLIQLKLQSLRALGKEATAYEEALDASEWIQSNVSDGLLRDEYMRKITACLEEDMGVDPQLDGHRGGEFGSMSCDESQLLPGAISKIEMHFASDKGRILRTSQDIIPGEVLVKEKPIISSLDKSRMSSHCWECFEPVNERFVPCSSCESVKFCSFYCQKQSWTGHHEAECKFLDILQHVKGSHLTLRLLRTVGIAEALAVAKDKLPVEEWLERGFPRTFHSFASLHSHWEHLPAGVIYRHAFAGGVAALVAERMGLTSRSDSNFYAVAGLILDTNRRLANNCWGVQSVNEIDAKGLPLKLGYGVYSTLSLASHSCDANAIQYYNGIEAVAIATRPIFAGEEVTMSYGPTVISKAAPLRRAFLKHAYNFVCNCNGCQREVQLLSRPVNYDEPPPSALCEDQGSDLLPAYQPWHGTNPTSRALPLFANL